MESITRRSFIAAAVASAVFAPSALAKAPSGEAPKGKGTADGSKADEKVQAVEVGALTFDCPADWVVLDSQDGDSPFVTMGPDGGDASVLGQRMDGWDMSGMFTPDTYVSFIVKGFADQMGYEFGDAVLAEEGGVSWQSYPYTVEADGGKRTGSFTFAFLDGDCYLVLATCEKEADAEVAEVLKSVRVDGQGMPGEADAPKAEGAPKKGSTPRASENS